MDKVKTKSLYLTLETHAQIKEYAKKHNTTMRAVLEKLLREYINKHG